jgi:hypothetical protein
MIFTAWACCFVILCDRADAEWLLGNQLCATDAMLQAEKNADELQCDQNSPLRTRISEIQSKIKARW